MISLLRLGPKREVKIKNLFGEKKKKKTYLVSNLTEFQTTHEKLTCVTSFSSHAALQDAFADHDVENQRC